MNGSKDPHIKIRAHRGNEKPGCKIHHAGKRKIPRPKIVRERHAYQITRKNRNENFPVCLQPIAETAPEKATAECQKLVRSDDETQNAACHAAVKKKAPRKSKEARDTPPVKRVTAGKKDCLIFTNLIHNDAARASTPY